MSRRNTVPSNDTPEILADRLHPLNFLSYGMLRYRNMDLLSSQVGEIIDDAKKFSVSIDVRNFEANEITVNTEGNVLKISAVHVDKNGKKQFERKYTMPDNVIAECSETTISPDKILTVTLFKKPL